MKTKSIILFGFCSFLLLFSLYGLVIYSESNRVIPTLSDNIYREIGPITQESRNQSFLKELRYYHVLLQNSVQLYTLTGDVRWRQQYDAYVIQQEKFSNKLLLENPSDPFFEKLFALDMEIKRMDERILLLVDQNELFSAQKLLNDSFYQSNLELRRSSLAHYFEEEGASYEDAIDISFFKIQVAADQVVTEFQQNTSRMLFFYFILVLVTVFLAILIVQLATRPIIELTDAVNHVGGGKTIHDLPFLDDEGELGELSRAIKNAVNRHHVKQSIQSKTNPVKLKR